MIEADSPEAEAALRAIEKRRNTSEAEAQRVAAFQGATRVRFD